MQTAPNSPATANSPLTACPMDGEFGSYTSYRTTIGGVAYRLWRKDRGFAKGGPYSKAPDWRVSVEAAFASPTLGPVAARHLVVTNCSTRGQALAALISWAAKNGPVAG